MDINSALIHQRQSLLSQIVEPLLDLPPFKPTGTLLSNRRRCPGGANVRSQKMLFDPISFVMALSLFRSLRDLSHVGADRHIPARSAHGISDPDSTKCTERSIIAEGAWEHTL